MLPRRRQDIRGEDARFVIEQPLFYRKPAAEAGQRTVRADDAMAGEDDADGIGPVRGAERARRGRNAERRCLPAVAGRGAEWNIGQRPPCRELEARSLQVERNVEARAGAGEVFVELGGRLLQDWMIEVMMWPRLDSGARRRQPGPEDRPEPVVRRDQCQRSDRCAVSRAGQVGFGLHQEASFWVSLRVAHSWWVA